MNANASGATGALDTFERELRRASSLLEQGRFEQAYTWAAEALALRPAHLLAQNLLGLILYQQHRFGPALEVFEALVRKNPDVITLRMNAGLSALHGDQLERTLEHLRRAVDLEPQHRRAFAALALAHLRRGETHLARAALLEAGLEALAARFGDTVDPGMAQEIDGELQKQAEALRAADVPSPCEGFAEVTALVPLDGWREADLVSSQPEVPALGPELAAEGTLAEAEREEPPEQPKMEIEPATATAIEPATATAIEPATATATAIEPATATTADPITSTVAEPITEIGPTAEAQAAPPAETAEPSSADLDAAIDALAAPVDAPITSAEPSTGMEASPAPAAPQASEHPTPAPGRPDLPEAPVVSVEEERFDAGPTPISLVETWTAPAQVPAALGQLLPASAPEQRAKQRRRLAERLASMSLPGLERGPDAAIRYGALIIRLEAQTRGALLRADHLILERGELRWRPASRRRKGGDAGPFVVDGASLQVVSGDGLLVLRAPRAGQLELLNLDEEGLYIRESLLLAASAELHWENGRLPGLDEEPRFVHLRGSGYLALGGTERIFSLPVAEDQSLRIRLQHLLGWSGTTVPQLDDQEGIVGFSGSGVLLLQLA